MKTGKATPRSLDVAGFISKASQQPGHKGALQQYPGASVQPQTAPPPKRSKINAPADATTTA